MATARSRPLCRAPPRGAASGAVRRALLRRARVHAAPGGGGGGPLQPAAGGGARIPTSAAPRDAALAPLLEAASQAELSELFEAMYAPSVLSPLLKNADEASARRHFQLAPRPAQERLLEERLLFLAAGAADTLAGRRPSYTEALAALRDELGVACEQAIGAEDLEAEIFLWLLEQGGGGERALVDYNGSADASAAISYPAALHARSLAPVAAKAAAATAATVAARHAAIALAESGATAVAARAASAAAMRAGVSAAARAAAGSAAARYVASAVVPALWVSVGLDAARAATGRDVTRLTRAVALLAQIRLLRGGRTANRRLSEAA